MEEKYGFVMRYRHVDVFFVTSRKNKNKFLASAILNALHLPDNPDIRSEVLYYARPGKLSIKECNGRKMMDISGDGYGGWGNWLDEYQKDNVKPVYYLDK